MDSIKNSVRILLGQYQDLHNQLNGNSGIEEQRAFIHLFSSPKVLVVNDLERKPVEDQISVLDYATQLTGQYPEGLSMTLNLNRLAVSRPQYDRNNRYLVQARLDKSMVGISAGKVYSISHRIRVTIGFNFENGQMTEFLIWRIELPPVDENYAGILISPGLGTWRNRDLKQDSRFTLKPGLSYQVGISYSHFFNTKWGFESGIQLADYHGFLGLDRFDQMGAFNPDMKDISFDQHIWFLELPFGLAFKSGLSKRTGYYISAGGIVGFRLFESLTTTAINTNDGHIMEGVISDADWITGLNPMNFSLYLSGGISWLVLPKLSIRADLRFVRGLSPLDHLSQPDFTATRYLGQYNPLWRPVESDTNSQLAFLSVGAVWLINFEKK